MYGYLSWCRCLPCELLPLSRRKPSFQMAFHGPSLAWGMPVMRSERFIVLREQCQGFFQSCMLESGCKVLKF